MLIKTYSQMSNRCLFFAALILYIDCFKETYKVVIVTFQSHSAYKGTFPAIGKQILQWP